MAYDYFIQQGRFPREIDDLDVEAWLRIRAWHIGKREDGPAPRKRRGFIDDFD